MTQELEAKSTGSDTVPLGAAEYFVELHTPHRWSSGPQVLTMNPDSNYTRFASLAEAAAYAESRHNPTGGENSVEVSYGVRYVTVLD